MFGRRVAHNDRSVQNARVSSERAPDIGPDLGLTVAAVARRMGVAPATLRTWDRRYGLGPSEHRAGTHRRYALGDLARLEHMRRLVIAGVPPADAARAALEQSIDPSIDVVSYPPGDPAARPGGGRVLSMPGAGADARGLARAAQALDPAACTSIICDAVDRWGVVSTWDQLLVPVMVAIGQQWSDTGGSVEIEHALSTAVQHALSVTIRSLDRPVNTRTVLLTCAPGELHSLPLWGVAAGLAERRISARILGAQLPVESLGHAIRRTGPAAVFVWAQLPGTASTAVLSALPVVRPPAAVIIGGPGWIGELPKGVRWVSDLTGAIAGIGHAVGE